MIIYTRDSAVIRHGGTGKEFEVYEDELLWNEVGSDERSMGLETRYEAIVQHQELGELRWSVTEYPAGVERTKTTNVGKHEIILDFDYGLEQELEPDDPSDIPRFLKEDPDLASRLTKATLVQYLVNWFHYYHEDPAHETPYESREGGYQFIYGGPYSAEEALREGFEDVVDEQAILEAVAEIESDGLLEWSPSDRHPDKMAFYDDYSAEEENENLLDEDGNPLLNETGEEILDGSEAALTPEDGSTVRLEGPLDFETFQRLAAENEPANLGSEQERAARTKVLEDVAGLRDELPKPAIHGGIGHNEPPAEYALQGQELAEVSESLDVIEVELKRDEPDTQAVAERGSFLKRVVGYVAKKVDMTLDEFCKSFGSTLGKTVAIALPAAFLASPYWGKLVALLSRLHDWLGVLFGL